MRVTTAGIDEARKVFQVQGVDRHGKPVLRKAWERRRPRRVFRLTLDSPTLIPLGMPVSGGTRSRDSWGRTSL